MPLRSPGGDAAMKIRGWPRSIRFQLLFGLLLLETMSLLLFATVLIRQERYDTFNRAQQRLEHQAASVAVQAAEALQSDRPELIGTAVKMMGDAPSVAEATVTDPNGFNIASACSPSFVPQPHFS